jgi:hypothetical protein
MRNPETFQFRANYGAANRRVWNQADEALFCAAIARFGKQWAKMRNQMPELGRTDVQVLQPFLWV